MRRVAVVVCHCRAVNDRAVRTAVEAGARDVSAIGQVCSAGTRCGGCRPALEALLGELLLDGREPQAA